MGGVRDKNRGMNMIKTNYMDSFFKKNDKNILKRKGNRK